MKTYNVLVIETIFTKILSNNFVFGFLVLTIGVKLVIKLLAKTYKCELIEIKRED